MVVLDSRGEKKVEELNVGEKLRAIRSQRNMSRRILAEESGLSVNTLTLIRMVSPLLL